MSLPRPLARHKLAVGLVVGLLAGSLLAVGGAAFARIPDSRTGVITACRSANGTVRLIDAQARQRCRRGETVVRWNATGPRGPQGLQGPTGATGPAGPTLPVIRRTTGLALSSPGTGADFVADVPKGSYVMSTRITVTSTSITGGTAPTTVCYLTDLDKRAISTYTTSVGPLPTLVLAHASPGGPETLMNCQLFRNGGGTSASSTMQIEVLLTPTPAFG